MSASVAGLGLGDFCSSDFDTAGMRCVVGSLKGVSGQRLDDCRKRRSLPPFHHDKAMTCSEWVFALHSCAFGWEPGIGHATANLHMQSHTTPEGHRRPLLSSFWMSC